MLKSLSSLTAGLTTIAIMLIGAIYILLGLQASSVAAEPAPQGHGPGQGPFGTSNQNNCSGYMAGYGYRVDAVGHPKLPSGSPDPQSVVMLMPLQSPSFQPGHDAGSDSQTQKQLSLGLIACALYYPGVPVIGIGLEQGQSILMYSAQSADVLAVQKGTMSTEDFWAQVGSNRTVLDARTGKPLSAIDFINKDFTGRQDMAAILPPNVEPPSKGNIQIRFQASTAYVTPGDHVDLVATVLDGSRQVLAGRSVAFTYTPIQGDPVPIGTDTTGSDGAARIRFTVPPDLTGAVMISAGTNDSGGNFNASIPVTIGSSAQGTASPASVISASLRLQGYGVVDPSYALHYLPDTPATMIAEVSAPRFDSSVRAEILTIGGTLLEAYPAVQSSAPLLLYRNQDKAYLMLFHIERADWDSWLAGSIEEATLWHRIALTKVLDSVTGMPVNARDFLHKNFSQSVSTSVFTSPREITGSITNESWGDQLRTGHFQVPIDSTADTFSVIERTPASEFAIFSVPDPIHPLYESSTDADGSRLQALKLRPGQYLLSVTVGSAPSVVRLSYLEQLGNSSDTP
jgi:hypothetical protein